MEPTHHIIFAATHKVNLIVVATSTYSTVAHGGEWAHALQLILFKVFSLVPYMYVYFCAHNFWAIRR